MAIINLSWITNFLNGEIPSGDTVSTAMYEAAAPTPGVAGEAGRDIMTSFEMINGWMDDANMRDDPADPGTGSGWGLQQEVTSEMIATGALTRWGGIGATANLDYFSDLFSRVDPDGIASQPHIDYESIPGASVTFSLPYNPSAICFTWQLYYGNDMNQTTDNDSGGACRLFLTKHKTLENAEEDNAINEQYRRLMDCRGSDRTDTGAFELGSDPAIDPVFRQRFRTRDRTWSGHYLWHADDPDANNSVNFTNSDIQPLWYSASIKIYSESHQTRVRVRNFKYIAFK